jgi:predicted nucleotidyltransferase component of viral defense system
MISKEQAKIFAKNFGVSEYVVLREYLQILFLKHLYEQSFSKELFFKGGTAIRLLYGGERFSEDLDFTVGFSESIFESKMGKFFSFLKKHYDMDVKEREPLAGKTSLLTKKVSFLKNPVYIRLDFSMREDVQEVTKNILKTGYPIIVQNFIFSLSKDEILAEKVRAVLKREKPRDLYDLWVLQELGAKFNLPLIQKKLSYYGENFSKKEFLERIGVFKKESFKKDLAPFISKKDREKLEELFEFVQKYLEKQVNS